MSHPPPPGTVAGLATHLGVSESKLRRHWRRPGWTPAGIRELLHWRLLFRWLQMADQMTVDHAAEVLHIDPRTLERTTRDLVGRSPRSSAADPDRAVSMFEDWALKAF